MARPDTKRSGSPSPAERPSAAGRGTSRRCGRLLLVGADPELLAVARHHLGPRGWKVVVGADSEAALVAAGKAPPDVMLVNLGLPGIDGLTFVHKARLAPLLAKVPIILTGARNLDHETILTEAMGAVAHLSRPYGPGRVEAAIALAMGGARGA